MTQTGKEEVKMTLVRSIAPAPAGSPDGVEIGMRRPDQSGAEVG
jgi:hypothetical protein